jgi:hypothetical protein
VEAQKVRKSIGMGTVKAYEVSDGNEDTEIGLEVMHVTFWLRTYLHFTSPDTA